ENIPAPSKGQGLNQESAHTTQARGREGGGTHSYSPTALRPPPGHEYPLSYRWSRGWETNLAYLMEVNAAAGRVLGDSMRHPFLPWVTDFSVRLGVGGVGLGSGLGQQRPAGKGWRDLTRTKFRLRKGDTQLDKTYAEANPPHHVTECLSELTLTVYLARRLPLEASWGVLQRVVRSSVVAAEYPSTMARLYAWTPDECIPEFYTDPGVFTSIHRGEGALPDLEPPTWCDTPSNFVEYHRSLLESPEVSSWLHLWIDLSFGYCLSGQAAVDAKNVPLPLPSAQRNHGRGVGRGLGAQACSCPDFIQLFQHPHPPRRLGDTRACPTNSLRPPHQGQGMGGIPSPPGSGGTPTQPSASPPPLLQRHHRPKQILPLGARHTTPSGHVTTATGAKALGAVRAMPMAAGRAVLQGREEVAEGSGLGRKVGGGAMSIMGVAFEDYIGEDGVRSWRGGSTRLGGEGNRVEEWATEEGVLGAGAGTGAGTGGWARGWTGSSSEEERRALSFALDVELLLEPWYGPPAQDAPSSLPDLPAGPLPPPPGASASPAPPCPRVDALGSGRGGARGSGSSNLLACGCILAEMYAGEPVIPPPCRPGVGAEATGGRARGSGAAASGARALPEDGVRGGAVLSMGLPAPVRGAIGALVSPDPSQRPSASKLLATAELPTRRQGSASPARWPPQGSRSRNTAMLQSPKSPALEPYHDLFPPYFRDVYAFLSALQHEDTSQKRLRLAAATLPVLQVPLHAFYLALPHLLPILHDL
ncbi:unnamed protein product, partial [Discosporangium mesarthrocarpum]